MKKLVPGILALLMCFGCLAGCGESESPSSDNSTPGAVTPNPDDSTPDEDAATLDEAATALSAKIDLLPTEDRVDYSLPNSVFVAITKFTVAWEVECATDGMVSLTAGTTETNVTVSKSADETTAYTLKATITAADGTTKVVTFDCSVLEAPAMMPDPITAKPVEGVDYKLYVYQTNPSANYADCYFDGEMSGWYFRTSSDYTDAVDMHVEYIAGTENFNISFTQKSTNAKKYIYVETGWNETNNHEAYNVKIGDTPGAPFYWDAEKGAMLTTIPCRQSGEGKEVTDFTIREAVSYCCRLTYCIAPHSKSTLFLIYHTHRRHKFHISTCYLKADNASAVTYDTSFGIIEGNNSFTFLKLDSLKGWTIILETSLTISLCKSHIRKTISDLLLITRMNIGNIVHLI